MGVVVVHGVADQAPGATLALFTKKLVAARVLDDRGDERPLTLTVPAARSGGAPALAEVARRVGHATPKGASVDLFELTWSDLSRPGTTLVALVRAFVGLLANLPTLGLRELGAARDAGWAGAPTTLLGVTVAIHEHVVPTLLGAAIACFAGLPALTLVQREPAVARAVAAAALGLAPVVFLLARGGLAELGPRVRRPWRVPVLLAAFFTVATLGGYGVLEVAAPIVLSLGSVVLVAVLGTWLMRDHVARRRDVVRTTGLSAAVCVVFAAGGTLATDTQQLPAGLAAAITLVGVRALMGSVELLYILTSVTYVVGLVTLLAAAAYGWVRCDGGAGEVDRRRHALRTAVVAAGLPMVAFLLVALPALAAVFDVVDRAELVPSGEVGAWLHPSLDAFADPDAQSHSAAGLAARLVRASGTRLFLAVLSAMAFAAIVFLVVAARVAPAELAAPTLLHAEVDPRGTEDLDVARLRHAERNDALLSRWLERGTYVIADWTAVATLVAAAFIVLGFAVEASALHPHAHKLLRVSGIAVALARASGDLVFGTGALLAGSASILAFPGRARELLSPLWPVLDILLDVEGYLREGAPGSSVQHRIHARAHALLDHVEASHDEVVIVAHSQGTLIALDVLRARRRRATGKPTRLVTMGSPVANLYHRFLPHLFGWLEVARREPEAELGVTAWDNVYCGGDYVGRSVIHTELLDRTERDPVPNSTPAGASGRALRLRGHRGWTAAPDATWHWERGVREHRLGPLGHTRYWDVLGADGDAVTEVVAHALAGTDPAALDAREPREHHEPGIGSLTGVLLACATGLGAAVLVLASALIGPFIMFTLPFLLLFGFAVGPLVAAAHGTLDGDHAAGLRGALALWSRGRDSDFSVETVPISRPGRQAGSTTRAITACLLPAARSAR